MLIVQVSFAQSDTRQLEVTVRLWDTSCVRFAISAFTVTFEASARIGEGVKLGVSSEGPDSGRKISTQKRPRGEPGPHVPSGLLCCGTVLLLPIRPQIVLILHFWTQTNNPIASISSVARMSVDQVSGACKKQLLRKFQIANFGHKTSEQILEEKVPLAADGSVANPHSEAK